MTTREWISSFLVGAFIYYNLDSLTKRLTAIEASVEEILTLLRERWDQDHDDEFGE